MFWYLPTQHAFEIRSREGPMQAGGVTHGRTPLRKAPRATSCTSYCGARRRSLLGPAQHFSQMTPRICIYRIRGVGAALRWSFKLRGAPTSLLGVEVLVATGPFCSSREYGLPQSRPKWRWLQGGVSDSSSCHPICLSLAGTLSGSSVHEGGQLAAVVRWLGFNFGLPLKMKILVVVLGL